MIYVLYNGPAPARIDRVVAMNRARPDDLAPEPGQSWIEASSPPDLETDYVAAGPAIAARPAPAAPPALSAGVAAEWIGLPPGATVRAIDPTASPAAEVGSAVADEAGALTLALPEAGPWRLVVDELWPWRRAEFAIEVAA